MQTLKQKQINMRRFACLALLMVLSWAFSARTFAQDGRVSGTIRASEDNAPLVGVTVTNQNTKSKTVSDGSGKFSIAAKQGEVLVFSYIGYGDKKVTVGSNSSINVNLTSNTNTIEDVVVTAMDIKRNPRELGYSVQTVDGDELKETQRENFLNGLQGRVAGLTINPTSGNAGASSSIVLRGFNSLTQSNQPLFVIDGVIIDNNTVDENSDGGRGVGIVERGAGLTNTNNKNSDYNNRISDLNPNDIASITVLKGPEATALYGSQASSGAIIITTKKAKSTKLAIQYDNSFRIQSVTRSPEIFDGYTNGTNGVADNVFRYYGPAYAPGTQTHNNIDNFFKTGFSQTHNLGLDFGFKNSMFRVSGSFFDQEGVIPTNDYKRYTARISNTTKIGNWMDITPTLQYINIQNNKVLRGAGGFMLGLLLWPTTNDIRTSQGDNATKDPLFASSASPNAEFDNPLFNVNNNKSRDETNRLNTSLGINIRPTDWLTLAGRFGYETYNTESYLRYHPLSYYISAGTGGIQDNQWRKYTGYNHTITATAKKSFGAFNFRVMGGTMWQDYKTEQFAITGTNLVDSVGLVTGQMYKNGVPLTSADYAALGAYSDSNITRPSTRIRLLRNYFGEYNYVQMRQIAYFGEFAANWKELIYLNYTHRFEQASTLPKKNRNYNYPGGSLSFIISDIFPSIKNNVLNYLKLRGSVAGTARLNSPYSTQSVFANSNSSGGGFSYGFFNNNPDLGPERQTTFEVGTEMRLIKNKVSLELAYYNTLNKDQIIENLRLSYGTGFVLNTQNAGSTRNQGIEISIDATAVKNDNFFWNTRLNFNKMRSKIVGLPKNLSFFYLSDTNVYGSAAAGVGIGGSTTTISGLGYLRNNNGQLVISPTTGLPVTDPNQKVRGDRMPDFTLGWNNILSYKNWKLNFLWDLKVGGDVYNGTNQYLTTIGRSKLTADRMTPRVVQGVLQDGMENSATPTVNTISVTPYYNDQYYRLMPEELFIEKDVNWLRLRDVTLQYSFNQDFLQRLRYVKGLGAFVTLNDVFLLTNYKGADPSVNAGTAGTRGVGAFGFDYGTMPAQLSINFGIRASF